MYKTLMRKIAKFNKLARELKNSGSPTTGENAVKLWEELSNHNTIVPAAICKKLYLKAGYKPFMGYPLIHK